MTTALDIEEIVIATPDGVRVQADLEALQRELADEAATSDVDTCCLREVRDGVMWYDLGSVEEKDREWLTRAVRYLDMRQMLERDPANSNCVSFRT
jgi:hypothetical protein